MLVVVMMAVAAVVVIITMRLGTVFILEKQLL